MPTISQDFDATKIRAWQASDRPGFSVEFVPTERIISSDEGGETTIEDYVYDASPSATYYKEGFVAADSSVESQYESADESIFTIDSNGMVSHVADGTAGAIVTSGPVKKRAEVTVEYVIDEPTNVPLRWDEGSLGETAEAEAEAAIDGITASGTLDLYSSANDTTGAYTRNANLWASKWVSQLAAVAAWNSQGNSRLCVTAITKRHCIGVPHYNYIPSVGRTIRFVTPDGTTITRTVIAREYPDGYTQPVDFPDLGVCLLDSDLPESIVPVDLVPADLGDYLVKVTDGKPPVLVIPRGRECFYYEHDYRTSQIVRAEQSSDATKATFAEAIAVGDSGSPMLLPYGDRLALLTCLTSAGTTGGSFYTAGTPISSQLTLIQSLIDACDTAAGISTGYTLTTADLSEFNSYA